MTAAQHRANAGGVVQACHSALRRPATPQRSKPAPALTFYIAL